MNGDAAYRAPFFSLDLYRAFFKPLHQRHVDLALESGWSEQFLEDWLEMGIRGWTRFQVADDCKDIEDGFDSHIRDDYKTHGRSLALEANTHKNGL